MELAKIIKNGTTEIMGIQVPIIEGGFGEGKRCMLVKQVADIHQTDMGELNRLIKENYSEFDEGIDIIDLKNSMGATHSLLQIGYNKQSISNSNNIYLLSEQGYMALVGLMRNEKAKEIRKELRRNYFAMREVLQQHTPSYMIGDPIERAKKWIEEQEQVKELIAQKDEVIEIQAPKVKVYDDFIDAEHSLGFRELRKQIEVALGITIKENDFKVIMRSKKLIGRTVKASAFAIRNGYAETKDVMDKYGNTRTQDRFTMKCRDMLVGHIKDIYSEEELIG